MIFAENKAATLAKIFDQHPDAQSADLGALKGEVGFWVILNNGAMIFTPLIEPVRYEHPPGEQFVFEGE